MPLIATPRHSDGNFCSICCEEDKPNLLALSKCSHKSCADCLVQWIEKVESTGQANLPGCPFCRVELSPEETQVILGRPFAPAQSRISANPVEADELTLQWLNEQTKPCPRCGALIEKLPNGCDMMECLCGYRFCYGCGAQGARCGCTPDTHSFWDNILDRNAGQSAAQEAPVAEETGHVNFMTHIEKRKKQDRDDKVRRRRASRRNQKARECQFVDEITFRAKWLFLPPKAAFKMLNQLKVQSRLHSDRQRKQRDLIREAHEVDTLVSTARWLFLPVVGAYKLLNQQKDDSKHHLRQFYRDFHDREDASLTPLVVSARWLFCNRPTAFRMLREQNNANRIHQERAWRSREQPVTMEDQPDQIIVSGSWLFRKKTPEDTTQQLKQLFRHQAAANRARTYRQWGRDLIQFGFDPYGGYHGAGVDPEAETERENAINIRIFFLSNEEKAWERREIAKHGL